MSGGVPAGELLPCPFCGSAAEILENPSERPDTTVTGRYFVRCSPCDLIIDSAWDVPYDDAVRAWNTRATPTTDAPVTVEQCDREAAANLVAPHGRWPGFPADFRSGRADRNELTQAFAHHRLAALASSPAGNGERDPYLAALASLRAAISLLERGGKAAKKAAPSDKMFDQMIADYKRAAGNLAAALARPRV